MSLTKILAVLFVLAALVGLYAYGTYSNLVSKQVDVKKSWSDVETQYQRRADIIPRMVKVADTSMKFQVKLPMEYAKAREGLDLSEKKYRDALANTKDPQSIQQAEQAWKDVQANWKAIDIAINARTESVPTAQLDQLSELNNEMAAIENVIAGKRQAYNSVVADYNKYVLIPPSSWLASYWGFDQMKLFEAQKGAENAPAVDFNFS